MSFLYVVLKARFLCKLEGTDCTVMWGVVDKAVIVENTRSPKLLAALRAFIRLLLCVGNSVSLQSITVFKLFLANPATQGIFFFSQLVFTNIAKLFLLFVENICFTLLLLLFCRFFGGKI